jgi:ABC-type bacteriocin/lantibiotic exporter with double-glycine peptidase domain
LRLAGISDILKWITKTIIILEKYMGLIKDLVDKAMSIPKHIEENISDESSSFLDMDRSMQLDGYSCGVQSTYSILKYYGKARSIDNVDNQLNAYDRGYASETSIYKLFRTRKLKISKRSKATIATIKEAIDDYEAPMLTTIDNESHWIVVYGYSKSKIYVLDSVGLRPFVKWSKDKFKERWDNWGAIIYK